jgi:DUF4097 and DUF4098 domain-containing protein YvlB
MIMIVMKNLRIVRIPLIIIGLACVAALESASAAKKYSEEMHKTYPLTADGKVSLGNVNGAVRITTWDKAEVQLDAVKYAQKEEDLEEVKIDVRSESDSLRIETKFPTQSFWRRGNSAHVDYTLKVPREVRLDKVETVNGKIEITGVRGHVRAATVNGTLEVEGFAGGAKLSTVNGRVRARCAKIESDKDITLETVNGGAELAIPAKANARLKASSVNGSISTDFEVPVTRHFPLGRDLDAQLGDGGPRIKVSTVNGSIRITRAEWD